MRFLEPTLMNIEQMFKVKVKLKNHAGHLMSLSIKGLRVEEKLVVEADLKFFGRVHLDNDIVYCRFNPIILTSTFVKRISREDMFLLPKYVRLENRDSYNLLLSKIKSHDGFFSHAIIENQNIISL